MNIFIFKTNIRWQHEIQDLDPIIGTHPDIVEWSVDIEDIDNVLRIVANPELNEMDVIDLINSGGFSCESM